MKTNPNTAKKTDLDAVNSRLLTNCQILRRLKPSNLLSHLLIALGSCLRTRQLNRPIVLKVTTTAGTYGGTNPTDRSFTFSTRRIQIMTLTGTMTERLKVQIQELLETSPIPSP